MQTIDDKNWEIPAHTRTVLKPKQHKYALVIPVINEGDKILRQLDAICTHKPPVDVIIADGGSTDGSMEPDKLNKRNVRTLITKTDSGRLSSQLRCAYAYALKEGYIGILTMDGNGKDGIEGIAKICQKLDDGYDYIQGSRYFGDGTATHTPLDRAIGNRLVHAPLMSMAGKHKFTDTTNGFRGYSSSYLLDNRVNPFRSAFVNYELLFYLTVRAGQIGKKVCEVGVTRAYPKTGKTPTKINGLSPKLKVLWQTVKAAAGQYKP